MNTGFRMSDLFAYLYKMEQIIPILIAAVVFGFQAYANYQKEQEKARKRKYGQQVPDDTIPVEQSGKRQEARPERRPVTPSSPRQEARRHNQPEYTPFEIPSSPYEQYQGMLEPEEMSRARKNRASAQDTARDKATARNTAATKGGERERSATGKHRDLLKSNLGAKVELTDLDHDYPGGTSVQDGIDLRQAVIHSIILERPYQDGRSY